MADFTSPTGSGYVQISMQEASWNQGGNYSTVNWQFYLVCGNGQSWNSDPVGWSANVGGVGYGGTYTFDFRAYQVKMIAASSVNVGHDGNGYGSCYGTGYTNHTGTSAIGGPWSVGGTIGLSRIPKPPSAPGATMSVTSRNDTSISVSFGYSGDNGGSGITSYTMQLATDSAFSNVIVQRDVAGSPQTFTGLTRVTPYYIRWRANNGVGSSGWSPTFSTATLSAPASAPQGLSAIVSGIGQVTLTWSAPSDNGGTSITSYDVDWSTTSDFATIVGTTNVSTTTAVASGLTPGSLYYFRVRANNADIGGAYTSISFIVASGAKLWTGSVWKPGVVRVWTGTGWKVAKVYVCSDATTPTWRLAK